MLESYGQKGTHVHCWWESNWYKPLWRTVWRLLKNLRLQLLCVCVYVCVCMWVHVLIASVMSNSYVTTWTVACQAPLSMEFSRQEYWSRLPFPSPGGLPDPGTEPESPELQADSLPLSHQGSPCCYLKPKVWVRILRWATWTIGILCP